MKSSRNYLNMFISNQDIVYSSGNQLANKNLGHSNVAFGQSGLSNSTLQPSQPVSFIHFEPGNQLFGTSQILGTTQTQNVNNSQIIGSMVPQR